jgi:hypothetical protein
MNTLLTLFNVEGIFCDALVNDDQDGLIFASLWGRDTTIQELLARLTLSSSEGGISKLIFKEPNKSLKTVHLGDQNRLDKLTGRMPKTNILGDMVQLMLFDRLVQTPDYANQKGYLLFDDRQQSVQLIDNEHNENKTWHLFKSICHLPMLDEWQYTIDRLLKAENWMKFYPGFCASAIAIDLPEAEFDQKISQMIIDGELTI